MHFHTALPPRLTLLALIKKARRHCERSVSDGFCDRASFHNTPRSSKKIMSKTHPVQASCHVLTGRSLPWAIQTLSRVFLISCHCIFPHNHLSHHTLTFDDLHRWRVYFIMPVVCLFPSVMNWSGALVEAFTVGRRVSWTDWWQTAAVTPGELAFLCHLPTEGPVELVKGENTYCL